MTIFSSPKTNLTNLTSRSFVILILVAVLFSLSIIPAFACAAQPAPSSYPQYTLKERVDHVPYVFSGTIVDLEYKDTTVAVVRVTNYFKGSGPEIVRISGFSRGADCQETVTKNQQAFFFVSGSPATGFHASSTLDTANYVKPTDPLSDKLSADIQQATGQKLAVPVSNTAIQPAGSANTNLAIGYLLLAGGPVLIFGGLLIYLVLLGN